MKVVIFRPHMEDKYQSATIQISLEAVLPSVSKRTWSRTVKDTLRDWRIHLKQPGILALITKHEEVLSEIHHPQKRTSPCADTS